MCNARLADSLDIPEDTHVCIRVCSACLRVDASLLFAPGLCTTRQYTLHDIGPQALHDIGPQALHDIGPQALHDIGPQALHDIGPQALHDLPQEPTHITSRDSDLLSSALTHDMATHLVLGSLDDLIYVDCSRLRFLAHLIHAHGLFL